MDMPRLTQQRFILSPVGNSADNKPTVVPVENRSVGHDTTDNRLISEPSVRSSTHFDVETLDFNLLTDRLLECERRQGLSTLEMFRRFISGEYDNHENENIEAWFDYLYLYLGTEQVRRVSCP